MIINIVHENITNGIGCALRLQKEFGLGIEFGRILIDNFSSLNFATDCTLVRDKFIKLELEQNRNKKLENAENNIKESDESNSRLLDLLNILGKSRLITDENKFIVDNIDILFSKLEYLDSNNFPIFQKTMDEIYQDKNNILFIDGDFGLDSNDFRFPYQWMKSRLLELDMEDREKMITSGRLVLSTSFKDTYIGYVNFFERMCKKGVYHGCHSYYQKLTTDNNIDNFHFADNFREKLQNKKL